MAKKIPEKIFELIADYTYDWELWVDGKGKIKWTNTSVKRMTGYTAKECLVINKFPNNKFFKSNKEELKNIAEAIKNKKPGNDVLLSLTKKDKQNVSVGVSWQPFYDGKKYIGVRFSIRNMDERKKIEDDLLESKEKYKTVFDLSPEAIVLIDNKGKVLDLNDRLYEWLGYKKEEILGKNFLKLPFLPKHSLLKVGQKFSQRMSGKEVLPYELDFLDKKDKTKIGLVTAVPIVNTEGKVVEDLVMISDISERKEVENKLQQEEQRFRYAFENSPIGMAMVSKEGRWIKVNSFLCDVLGYTKEELLQKTFQDITYPDDLDKDLSYVKKMLQKKITSYKMEKRYIHKSGRVVWALLSGSSVFDENGKLLYFIAQIQDIDESKKSSENLAKKIEELESMNNLMIGRELKMVELKEKIKKLQSKK